MAKSLVAGLVFHRPLRQMICGSSYYTDGRSIKPSPPMASPANAAKWTTMRIKMALQAMEIVTADII
jgi:hypothetical protein